MKQIRVTTKDAVRVVLELAEMARQELGTTKTIRCGRGWLGSNGWAVNHALKEFRNATQEEKRTLVRAWIAEDRKKWKTAIDD